VKQYILLVLCFVVESLNGTSFYSYRSFNQNASQILINYTTTAPYKDKTDFTHALVLTPEYTHTIKQEDIAQSLFGEDLFPFNGRQVIRISGSTVESRGSHDWLADYFGLREDFSSLLSFEPFIENFVLYFNWYASHCGCRYVRLQIPLVHTIWNIGLIEHDRPKTLFTCEAERGYPPGYFADMSIFYQDVTDDIEPLEIPCRELLCSFQQYASDCLAPNLVTPNNSTLFEPLQFSKMEHNSNIKTHLAELQCALGHVLLDTDRSHGALEVILWIPTGNKPEGHFLFEPIVGNCHHWQLGAGISGDTSVLHNDQTDRYLNLYAYGYISHPFNTTQTRTFDLCNSPNSRYMLAMKLGTPVTNLVLNGTPPSAQFQGIFTPIANLSNLNIKVHIDWQVDVAALLQYRSRNFYVDVGYNFWGRACEKITLDCATPFDLPQWALKGDSFVYGFVPEDVLTPEIQNMPITLSPTQSQSTIYSGTNRPIGAPPLEPSIRNAGVDNAQPTTLPDDTLVVYGPRLSEDPDNQQRSSLDPIFITTNDINLCSAQTKGQSHSFFAHLGYTWSDYCPFVPSLGIGLMVELARSFSCTAQCAFATPSQIAIWVKGGFTF
jgi:hypothetical protein